MLINSNQFMAFVFINAEVIFIFMTVKIFHLLWKLLRCLSGRRHFNRRAGYNLTVADAIPCCTESYHRRSSCKTVFYCKLHMMTGVLTYTTYVFFFNQFCSNVFKNRNPLLNGLITADVRLCERGKVIDTSDGPS